MRQQASKEDGFAAEMEPLDGVEDMPPLYRQRRRETAVARPAPVQLADVVYRRPEESGGGAAGGEAVPVAGAQAPDLDKLARQVYQLLTRRLRTEFERAHGSRKHL